MKKLTKHRLKAWTERIPRKTRFFLYMLAIICMTFLFYIFIGAPSLSREHRYRRAERAHFVGPGKILGYEEVSGSLYTDVVVAQTEEGIIIANAVPEIEDGVFLLYVPKTGRITVTAAPMFLAPMDIDFKTDTLTVFAVHDYPEAVRAEMDLQLYWQQQPEEEPLRPVFHLLANREEDGYFRFDAPFESLGEDTVERKALDLYCQYTRMHEQWQGQWIVPDGAYKATVRLYDGKNNLIVEEMLTLFS